MTGGPLSERDYWAALPDLRPEWLRKAHPEVREFARRIAHAAETAARSGPPDRKRDEALFRAARSLLGDAEAATMGPSGTDDEVSSEDACARITAGLTYNESLRDLEAAVDRCGPLRASPGYLSRLTLAYLAGPLRDHGVDRVLFRGLIDAEITRLMADVSTRGGKRAASGPLSPTTGTNPLWLSVLLNFAVAVAALALLIVIVVALSKFVAGDPTWPLVSAVQGWAVVAFGTGIAVIFFGVFKHKDHIRTVCLDATRLRNRERVSPNVSLRQLRHDLDRLKAVGMVWPEAVWDLLDDLERRGVHFFSDQA